MVKLLTILILIATLLTPYIGEASKLLFISPFPVKSHWLWLDHFVRHLLGRGHHLTIVSNFHSREPHENLTEIIIDPMYDIPAYIPKSTAFEMRYANDFNNVQLIWNIGLLTTEHAFKDAKVQKLIASKKTKFDLLIMEQFYHESFLMFAHKFKCPIVTIGTLTYNDNMDHAMGTLSPWAIAPHFLVTSSGKMNFKERAYNALVSWYDNFLRAWSFMPKMQNMAEKYFKGHVDEPMPDVRDIERNISFMFINSHRATDPPRPKMPGLIDVGGAHVEPAKPLPADLKKFLDQSTKGVVYFSLGSYMHSAEMPKAKLQMLLKAFGKLKQNVLWKFEDESLKNLPSNVMIRKWMPQNDILAHPNVKVFITHSGVFGTQEGIYWGKPMLCLPLYSDQHRNALKVARNGMARVLNFAAMTEQDIFENLQALLQDASYEKHAKALSARFRDNPLHPLDETAHWIEHTIRHQGAAYLKSAGIHLTWYQFLLLDVFICTLAAISIALYVILKILKVFLALFKRNAKNCDKSKKKQ